jgi:peptidoglycan/xylan/chitin deacetylase (PgdA/CDA1 family)
VTPAPTSSPTAIRTPPALPALFQTDLLNPKDTPHTYIADACQQLKDKWTPGNAAPGTVVLPVMFHSVADQVTTPNQISFEQFRQLMKGLKARGFEAIDTAQLAGFLEHNTKIPPRSVILIADDRHYAEYFNRLFRPYHDKYNWPVVNAWISAVDTPPGLWQENVDLEKEGWVDHQAHGVVHNIPAGPGSSDQYLLGELQGSIDAFKQHFDKTPMAYIWPGGGFTPRSVELARQTGYQLGFTVNPRGPVMFDWVPQADKTDDMRPSYIAEGPAGDPLLTLPRYWDTDALSHLDTVVAIADAAAAYAQQSKATELEYYDIVCAPTLGPLAGQ